MQLPLTIYASRTDQSILNVITVIFAVVPEKYTFLIDFRFFSLSVIEFSTLENIVEMYTRHGNLVVLNPFGGEGTDYLTQFIYPRYLLVHIIIVCNKRYFYPCDNVFVPM